MSSQRTYKKLGEVINILNGFAFKSSNYVNDGIRVIRIANVQKGKIVDDAPAFYPLSYESEISRYMLREGDILLSLTGNVGRVGVLQKEMLPAALNQRVACLRFRGDDILPKYIFHLLNSDVFEQACIASSRGIAQLNMSTEWLKEYLLPIPPLSEQQSIVRELDAISDVIAAKNAQLRELDKLAKAVFHDMFGDPFTNEKGWSVTKLTDVSLIQYGFAFDSANFTEDSSYMPLVRIRDVVRGYSETYFKGNYPEGYIVRKGDYLIGMDGEFNIAPWQSKDALLNQRVCKLISDEGKASKHYLHYFMMKCLKLIEDETPSVTVKHLSAKRLNQITLPLPPLDLQQSFAAKIQAIEAQKQTLRQSIAEFESLLAQRMDVHFG